MKRETILSEDRRYRFTLWREWINDPEFERAGSCHAASDGECIWVSCPQRRDQEPDRTGRHCILDRSGGYLMVIGLNPSTADETKNDPTIRKCIGFAKRWGFEGLCMTNLFAFRATQPKEMLKCGNPIGDGNESYLREIASDAGMILAAWGTNGSHLGRDQWAKRTIPNLMALKINRDGSPMHPLYVPYETVPVRFNP